MGGMPLDACQPYKCSWDQVSFSEFNIVICLKDRCCRPTSQTLCCVQLQADATVVSPPASRHHDVFYSISVLRSAHHRFGWHCSRKLWRLHEQCEWFRALLMLFTVHFTGTPSRVGMLRNIPHVRRRSGEEMLHSVPTITGGNVILNEIDGKTVLTRNCGGKVIWWWEKTQQTELAVQHEPVSCVFKHLRNSSRSSSHVNINTSHTRTLFHEGNEISLMNHSKVNALK
jgi:hypothetical protein